MNKFVKAIRSADTTLVRQIIEKEPAWLTWAEDQGKNGLHYACGVPVLNDGVRAAAAFDIMKLLLDRGMDPESVHRIPDGACPFPATPLWYAYTRGRNRLQYTYLLESGVKPDNCFFAIAWNDDVGAAELFKRYGAQVEDAHYLAAVYWKRYAIAGWFLDNGADINHVGPEGYSALLLAVKRRLPVDYILQLLQRGADPDKENREGVSPRKLAEQNRQRKILALFSKDSA